MDDRIAGHAADIAKAAVLSRELARVAVVLAADTSNLVDLAGQLTKQIHASSLSPEAVEGLEKHLAAMEQRAADARQTEAHLASAEGALAAREAAVSARELELTAREKKLAEASNELADREQKVAADEAAVKQANLDADKAKEQVDGESE